MSGRESFRRLRRGLAVLAVLVSVCAPAGAHAESSLRRGPNALYMGADVLIARPILLAMTAVGSALYIVSLPFALPGGNAGEAGRVMVVGPAKATFTRCLGCTTIE